MSEGPFDASAADRSHARARVWTPVGIWRLFTRRIAGKITLPYLFLLGCVFLVIIWVTAELVTSSLEQKYREELAGAGRSANEAMVLIERDNLRVLRQMIFTEGVDQGVANRDTVALQSLLAPIATNEKLSYVDVFGQDGRQFFALRPASFGQDPATMMDPDAAAWQPVQLALEGRTDPLGDKFADFVDSRWGPLFVSAAPVWRDGSVVGVVAVSVPVEDVTQRLSQEAGSKGITLYRTDGSPLASTIRASESNLTTALQLTPEQRASALGGSRVLVRRTTIGDVAYVEALSALAVRREASLILGTGNVIAIIQERAAEAQRTMMLIFAAVILLVIGIGLAVARMIGKPISTLLDAVDRIRRNDLDFHVPIVTQDEHGVLSAHVDDMRHDLQERLRAKDAIARYMSPKVWDLIQRGELKMGGESREITVIQSDIRDFTPLSEQMTPEALVDFLNQYFEAMVAPITKYDGEVDKYMGDSILAKFGATSDYADHARRAVLAMIEMTEALARLNEELRQTGKPALRMGIGANTGPAVVGNIGATERMEYTIISDAVNTTQRIQEHCKEVGWDLLISDTTYEAARDAIEVGAPWSIRLRGKTRDTLMYPVLGRAGEVSASRRRAYESLAKADGAAAPGAAGQGQRPSVSRRGSRSS